MQVMVTLSDEAYRSAERLAELTSRKVNDVLADTIELSLSPLNFPSEPTKPIATLTDAEILAVTELNLQPAQDQRLTLLLDKQQAGTLTEPEGSELLALMQLYQEKLLLKSQALREAVKRNLREPLAA